MEWAFSLPHFGSVRGGFDVVGGVVGGWWGVGGSASGGLCGWAGLGGGGRWVCARQGGGIGSGGAGRRLRGWVWGSGLV